MTVHSNEIDKATEEFLLTIYHKYGYDFREYSKAHIRRRLLNRMRLSTIGSIEELEYRVVHDPAFASQVVKDFSIKVTEMFRDPDFYKSFRTQVLPILKTWAYIKIWHAGCSTGEEVYSMAILLKEEGIYEKTQIYATDFNNDSLEQAKEGIYSSESIKQYSKNYQATNASGEFADYYHAKYDSAIMDSSLKKNIVWANHNLVTDADFTETHVIICRNVLIYFSKELQNKVHHLFNSSLVKGGILCLGNKESLMFTDCNDKYESLNKKQRIYKKKYL